jgi:hypothetical protein
VNVATNYNASIMSAVSVFEFPRVNLYKDGNPLCLRLDREHRALINKCKSLTEREINKMMVKEGIKFYVLRFIAF